MKTSGSTMATPDEIGRYRQYRSKGWSPMKAAEKIGKSKSWAYNFEKRQQVQEVPSSALSLEDAFRFVKAMHRRDERTIKRLVEAYGLMDLCVGLGALGEALVMLNADLLGSAVGAEVDTTLAFEQAEAFVRRVDACDLESA